MKCAAQMPKKRVWKQLRHLKQVLRNKNEAAGELKHKIEDLEEKLEAVNTRLARLVEVDDSFAGALEKGTQALVKNIEEYRQIVAEGRSGKMMAGKRPTSPGPRDSLMSPSNSSGGMSLGSCGC